jgi:hypothetical protein
MQKERLLGPLPRIYCLIIALHSQNVQKLVPLYTPVVIYSANCQYPLAADGI